MGDFANTFNNIQGTGIKRKHSGGWDGYMGDGPPMAQMMEMMTSMMMGYFGGDGYADIEQFILSNGIDERAANALRAESPAVQQSVLAKGGLSNAQNSSSALMVRIREAKNGGGGGGGCAGAYG